MKNTELNKKSMKKPDAFDCVFRDDDDSRKSGKKLFVRDYKLASLLMLYECSMTNQIIFFSVQEM